MSPVLAGLSIRTDLAGVSSIVRALGLEASGYRCLLYVWHPPGLHLEVLSAYWVRLVLKLFTPLRLGGRVVMIGEGLKVGKEGKTMPAVKKLHQSSANNSKAPYIFGHSFQALGLLACGPLGQLLCVPLISRSPEGVVFSNRDRRTLLDKVVELFLTVVEELERGVLLVGDAYYASRMGLCPLLGVGHHILPRVRCNALAYYPAPLSTPRCRGRWRLYGRKGHLRELWQSHCEQFPPVPSPVYGESQIMLRYYVLDLLWRPVGPPVRFVLMDYPRRGRLIVMSTDRTAPPLELLACYSYRFKIEVAFKQALSTPGAYAYHCWMRTMTPLSRRSGNQYLTSIVNPTTTANRSAVNLRPTIATDNWVAALKGCCNI
jgi:hypothetical protein